MTFDNPSRVYLLHGQDDRRKDEIIEQLRAAAISPDFADFDLETLDAADAGVERILAAAGQIPFGSPRRMVVVKSAELFRRRERSADAERLAQGIAALGDTSCLVLRVAAPAEEDWRRAKTALSASIDKAVKAAGTIIDCAALTAEGLLDWLMAEARKAGKRLDEDAGNRLLQSGGANRIALANELEKAICYVGERERIAAADVEAVCSYDAEDVMFKLVDAVSQRNADRSLQLLNETLRYDPKGQNTAWRLLSLLHRQLRLLWQARGLSEQGVQPGQLKNPSDSIKQDLPSDGSILPMAWKASELFRAAKSWDRPSLMHGMELLVQCDLNNKGGETGAQDVATNLEVLVIRLCRDGIKNAA